MLNLLPPAKKQIIEQELLYHFVRRCCIALISCTVLLGVVMFVSGRIAQFVLGTIQTRSTVVVKTPDQTDTTNQLTALTTLSADVSVIQKNFRQPLPLLLQALNDLPEGVTFTTLELDYAENSLQVSGVAPDREKLLELSRGINTKPGWTNVKFPAQDFTQKNTIPFEFEVTLPPQL